MPVGVPGTSGGKSAAQQHRYFSPSVKLERLAQLLPSPAVDSGSLAPGR